MTFPCLPIPAHLLSHLLLLLSTFLLFASSSAAPNPALLALVQLKSLPNQPPPSPDDPSHFYDLAEDLVQHAQTILANREDPHRALHLFRTAGIFGHSGAFTTAAALQLSGDHSLPRDIPSAVRHARFAADDGQPDANALLASLHASGLADRHGVHKSAAIATLLWTVSAGTGNTHASAALAFRHLHGIGFPKSCETAASLYRKVATAVATDPRYWPTPHNFVYGRAPLPSGLFETGYERLDEHRLAQGAGRRHDPDMEDRVQMHRHQAQNGDMDSRTTIGALYYFGGDGIAVNERVAREHLNIAANNEHGEAHALLGYMDMRQHKNESALLHFRYSTGYQSDMGHYAMGMIHRHGLLGMEQSPSQAKMHFELALEHKSHVGALFELGLIHWHGFGVTPNMTKGFQYFEEAAKLGHLQSKLYVGTILVDGSAPVGTRDCERGVQLLKSVAEDGEWRTLLDLAMTKIDEGDWYGALHRFVQSAHVGIELAQYNAAIILEKRALSDFPELEHWDRSRMLNEAYELYEFSAMQGHTDGLIRFANAVYSENDDLERAAEVFDKAARMENAEGMVSLALMCAQGKGVPRNRRRAEELLRAAKTDAQSYLPAALALAGMRAMWRVEDVWASVSRGVIVPAARIWEWLLPHTRGGDGQADGNDGSAGASRGEEADGGRVKRSGGKHVKVRLVKIAEDVALLGALLVALVAVVVVRSKRLARQGSTHSGRENDVDR